MRTGQKTARMASAALISLLGLSFPTSTGAVPQFESLIVVRHGLSYSYQEGGGDVAYAQESNSSGWVPTSGGYYDQSADVAAEASASSGILRASDLLDDSRIV